MKTKTLFLLCLILFAGLTRLSAQNGNGRPGTVVEYFTWEGYSLDIYCNGVMVDNVLGSVNVQEIVHFKDGQWVWAIHHCSGTVTSTLSGEVFEVKENDKKYETGAPTQDVNIHLVGNKGTRYILSFLFDVTTFELIPVKTVCN